jgi:hypothetical protein
LRNHNLRSLAAATQILARPTRIATFIIYQRLANSLFAPWIPGIHRSDFSVASNAGKLHTPAGTKQ